MSLKVDRISKRYKDQWILRDVSFEVSDGEVFGIFAPTAEQLTTVVNIVHSDKPTSGSVLVDGRDVTQTGERLIVSATRRPRFWQRVFDRGINPSSAERLGALDHAIDRTQRVLMLDEPFCGFDLQTRAACIRRIRDLARERNAVVLLASADFTLLLEACDRAVVILKGESRQVGTPQEIYENPCSRAVADLTGRNNLIAARRLTSSKAEVPEFHTIDGGHRLFAQRVERGSLGALNQNVTLAIRPEHISISFGASFPADNLVKATIVDVKFLGPTTSIRLDADGLKLEASVPRLVGLETGEECMVGLPPERIIVLKD